MNGFLLFDYCSIDAFHGHLKCSGGVNKLDFGRLVSAYSQKFEIVPQPQVRWILHGPLPPGH